MRAKRLEVKNNLLNRDTCRDALFTTESISKEIAEDPIPRRVLNLGCGHGSWCIEMLNKPGWENTHFDGASSP